MKAPARRLLDAFNRAFLWPRRTRIVDLPADGVVKVNLGSGLAVHRGWLHVDSSPTALFAKWPQSFLRLIYHATSVKQWYAVDEYVELVQTHDFVHHDLVYGLPFRDDTVDFLYSSHCLEHFYRADAKRLLAEAHRVLRPGGRIRVAVPDLEHVISLYTAGEKEQALELVFSNPHEGRYSQHRYLYDFDLIRALLEEVGFRDVERRAYREGAVPDVAVLDNRPSQTLFVEATK